MIKIESDLNKDGLISNWLVRFLEIGQVGVIFLVVVFIVVLVVPGPSQTTVYLTIDDQVRISNLYVETGRVSIPNWIDSKFGSVQLGVGVQCGC